MEILLFSPEQIPSCSVLLSLCLPLLFVAHLLQMHPFLCQPPCFKSFSACYWFFTFFFFTSDIVFIFPYPPSPCLSLPCYFLSASDLYSSFVHIFSFSFLSTRFQPVCSFFKWDILWVEVFQSVDSISISLQVHMLKKRHAFNFNFVAVYKFQICILFLF